MSKFEWPTHFGMRERNDALAAYRGRVIYMLAIVSAVVMLPMTAKNFMQGHYALGIGDAFGILLLAVDAVAIHFKRRPPIPFELILVPAIGGVVLTMQTAGVSGALWSYPVALLFHFALTRRIANVYCVLQLIGTSLMVHHLGGFDVAVRYFVTLLMTIVLINLALNIVDDLYRRLVAQTIVDPLTGAYNRRHMESCLDYAIERSRRSAASASLLLIDIDHFKRINDRHGHAAGDAVLKELVETIQHRARRLDLLFRTGGEEFLLLLPDTREEDALRLAEDFRAAVADTFRSRAFPVTVSIGVSELSQNETKEAWLKHADDALYLAKETGRDRVVRRADMHLLKQNPVPQD